MSTEYTHFSRLAFDNLFARKSPGQEVQILDSDGNISGINNITTTGALSVTSVVATGTITGSNLSGTNTGDITLTAVGAAPSANAASLSGQVLTIQPADGTHPGVVTSGAQTIGGNKTFSGSISASNLSGTNTGDQTTISGNAGTATALQTARAINGTSFNGTADITVTAAAGTVTGTTLAANVVSSSLTSVGTLANLTVTNPITGSVTGNAATVTTNANLTGNVTSVGNATTIASNVITNAMVNTSAAIAYSKLNLGTSIATGDLASGLIVPASKGGTGVANNAASTLTISGNFGTTLTVGNTTAVSLPASGTLAPGTNWTSYTPTVVGCGTVSNVSAFFKRVGDSVHVRGTFTCGTTTGVAVTISLPSGANTIDTTKIPGTRLAYLGSLYRGAGLTSIPATGAGAWAISFDSGDLTTVFPSLSTNSATPGFNTALGTALANSTDRIMFEFSVPVTQYAF
jgi:hypothetical protein